MTKSPMLKNLTQAMKRKVLVLNGRIGVGVVACSILILSILLIPIICAAEPLSLTASYYDLKSLKRDGQFKLTKGVMSNGKLYNENAFTCASRDFEIGQRVRVVSKESGRAVIVEVTDRINKRFKGKRIDLSKQSFKILSGNRLDKGLLSVVVEPIAR